MGTTAESMAPREACLPLSSGPHFLYQVEGHKGRGSWPFTNALCLRRSEMFSVTTADATRQSSVAGEFDSVLQNFQSEFKNRTQCV